MRCFCCLAVLLVLLVCQASSHQPAQRKSIRLEAVDYNPASQTVLLNITLDQSDARRFVNNFQVQVLRWLGNCRTEENNCSRRSSEVTVVQSRRICLAPLSSTAHINCHQIIPARYQSLNHTMTVTVQHIFTGCYCFRLATYRDDSIRTALQLLDRPLLMETNVIESDVFKWNLSLDLSATSQHDLSLFIRLDQTAADFDIYHIELLRLDELHDDLTDCHETDDPMNQYLTVRLNQSVHWIPFTNRSQGYYCVVVIPEDDRCHPPLVDVDLTCARHSNVVQLLARPDVTLAFYSEPDILSFLVAGLIIVLVVAAVTVYFALKHKMNQIDFGDDYQPIDSHKTINTPVLLFYSHENDKFIQKHVGQLKNAIRNYVSTQIYDDADDEESLAVEGVEWFTKYLQVANIRIVIIMCAEMMRCQEWIWNRKMDDNHQIDQVCCYRLEELIHHIGPSPNIYRQVFPIHFESFDDLDQSSNPSVPSSCFLTPYHRSYRWPAEQNAFLNELSQGYSNRVSLHHEPM